SEQRIMSLSARRVELHRRHMVRHPEADGQMVSGAHRGRAHDLGAFQRDVEDHAKTVAVDCRPSLKAKKRKRAGERGRHAMSRVSSQIRACLALSFEL